ncbi:PQQ-dependent sugar dehydrogenase [Leucobacter viscericola]|uniref:PQQ-dependent sugar dehydrogenase n=1 Tax=Leucobacter viscericola TaxID=2714935 RepID=A0A6G7XG65_9MICO|nr:PQQ-dependent sugar dehydrogenase [Leucobacter viscericola]QIK63368.1 PQQ-dependent sugar dehydrogenase [Leucobacter viscericola]
MTRATPWITTALVAAALVALTACAASGEGTVASQSREQQTSKEQPGQLETVSANLEAPWSIVFHGETPLVSERDTARILELDTNGKAREVATIKGVVAAGEGGLLGIATRDNFLYAYSTAQAGNRIERYRLSGEPGELRLGPAESLLEAIPAASNHNGGRIAFGPDGMLYATAGDAGVPSRAQDRTSLAGKILRMTPEGGVPADNPFDGSYVYSYGHRNPQGLAWSTEGVLYASEFGQNTWDELNIIVKGGNYGWPEVEGIAGQEGFIDPVQQWVPSEASPSGITISNDSIYIANLRGERLREVPLSDPASSTELFTGEYGRLRDVAWAPDGSLWILTNNTDGRGTPGSGDDRILRYRAGAG